MHPNRPRRTPRRAAFALALAACVAHADPLEQVLATGAESAASARQAQQEIERLADETRALEAEHRELRRQIDGLGIYNARLERQIADQQRRIAAIDQASGEATALSREIVPLLERMIDSLAAFIELDRPFQLAERRARIAELRAALSRADVPVASAFRAVLDAYASELAAGNGLHAESGLVGSGGTQRAASVLRVGRLALFAQSEDGATSWRWDDAARAWVELDDDAIAAEIADGLAIARGERPARLLRLPVPAVEEYTP